MSYTPPPPPDPSAYGVPQTGARPAELLDRFLARLIDDVLLFLVNVIFVVFIVIGAVMGSSGGVGMGGSYAVGIVTSLLSTAIYLGYFAFFESTRGQTIGKMLMKLRTVGPNGGNPTLEQAARRNIFMAYPLLGIIPFLGGLIGIAACLVGTIMIAVGINNDTVNRQAWHDQFAGGTRVLKEG